MARCLIQRESSADPPEHDWKTSIPPGACTTPASIYSAFFLISLGPFVGCSPDCHPEYGHHISTICARRRDVLTVLAQTARACRSHNGTTRKTPHAAAQVGSYVCVRPKRGPKVPLESAVILSLDGVERRGRPIQGPRQSAWSWDGPDGGKDEKFIWVIKGNIKAFSHTSCPGSQSHVFFRRTIQVIV